MRLSQKWKVVNVHQCCGENFNSRCFSNIRSLSHTVAKENHRRVHENCDRDCCFSITNFIFLYFTLCTTRVTRFVKRCLKHYSYFITLVIQINSPITNTYTQAIHISQYLCGINSYLFIVIIHFIHDIKFNIIDYIQWKKILT